jgi:hypothetical protein
MADLTDDDILELADQLAKELALTGDDRDVIVLRIQRLIWPPSPHYFLHELPHTARRIGQRDSGRWFGELRCPNGCARVWIVNTGPSEEAVHGALTAAHEEYRTGVAAPAAQREPGRLRLDDLFGRNEYVEVHDERLTS